MMVEQVELLVIGGGPGGLSAALAAAPLGASVTLVDAYTHPGGQYYRQLPGRLVSQSTSHQRQGQALISKVHEAGVRLLSGTTVSSLSPDRTLLCSDAHSAFLLRASAVIIASGAYERPVPFPGWTLPGVLMTGGIQTLLYQHVLPGSRVLLAGTGPLQLVVAKKLLDAGAEVAAVLEGSRLPGKALPHAAALWGQWERMLEGAQSLGVLLAHGVPYRSGWGILAARGEHAVTGALIARLDRDWRPIKGSEQEIACDTIGISFGLTPFNTLSKLAGAQQAWRPDLGGEIPIRDEYFETSLPGIYAVGDGAGIGGFRLSELEGQLAGLRAAAQLGYGKDAAETAIQQVRLRIKRERRFQHLYSTSFTPGTGVFELAQDDTLVCRCEGITYGRLREFIQHGSRSTQEVKNGLRTCMGECQGRMCHQAVLHILSRLSGKTIDELGLFSARPPVFPLSIGNLATLEVEE
jgi:NADPH-dependent 2,4-dienoyl-CoA reductase/sulfur reductase-like enzyme